MRPLLLPPQHFRSSASVIATALLKLRRISFRKTPITCSLTKLTAIALIAKHDARPHLDAQDTNVAMVSAKAG